MPIELFRTQKIISTKKRAKTFFKSSGTTDKTPSKHHIVDLSIYKKSILSCFSFFIDDPSKFVFLCLVPNFSNSPNSSLAFMCQELINASKHEHSGFYLKKDKLLVKTILECQKKKQNFILLGLSFEVLQFAEKNEINISNGIVIETGGTKKGKKSMIRENLHQRLMTAFKTTQVFSEYGMAELLSQSYYTKNKYFKSPPWKKILIRDKTNPFKIIQEPKRGCINIIDLANIYSCGFIATNDLGYVINDGFNIIGRNQNATDRGCNLMI